MLKIRDEIDFARVQMLTYESKKKPFKKSEWSQEDWDDDSRREWWRQQLQRLLENSTTCTKCKKPLLINGRPYQGSWDSWDDRKEGWYMYGPLCIECYSKLNDRSF